MPTADLPLDRPDPSPSGATGVRQELAHHARRLVRPTSVRQLPARGLVAVAACSMATLLLVASAAGRAAGVVTAAVVGVGALVLAAGWTRLVGLPSRRGTALTVSLAGLLLVASVVLPDDGATLRWVPGALALGVVAAFLHQLVRRDGRPRVVTSLSGTLLALGILAAGTTWVAVTSLPQAGAITLVAWGATCVAAAVEWACHRARLWPAVVPGALLAGGLAAAALGAAVDLDPLRSLLLGLGAAAPGLAARALFAPLPALVSARTQAISGVSSVLLAGPVVELLGRHLLG